MTQSESRAQFAQARTQPPWDGHHPATRTAMEGVLTRAASGRGSASLSERVLASICEFRALTASGNLTEYLKIGTIRKLGDARFALNEIGATDVAALLSQTLLGLHRTSAPSRRAMLLLTLEQHLLACGAILDELIAQYASCVRRQLARARLAEHRLIGIGEGV